MRHVFACTVAVSLVILGLAAEPRKKAWEWTLEERLAARGNPIMARERVRAKKVAQLQGPVIDTFNGRTNPELFLPYQVYEELVLVAFGHDARSEEIVRQGFAAEVSRHGLPNDFWERLHATAKSYLTDERALRDALERGEKNAVPLHQASLCRSRAAGLAAARTEFGRERFDRFLYEVIAVNMFSTVFDQPDDPELLRQAERGCQ